MQGQAPIQSQAPLIPQHQAGEDQEGISNGERLKMHDIRGIWPRSLIDQIGHHEIQSFPATASLRRTEGPKIVIRSRQQIAERNEVVQHEGTITVRLCAMKFLRKGTIALELPNQVGFELIPAELQNLLIIRKGRKSSHLDKITDRMVVG